MTRAARAMHAGELTALWRCEGCDRARQRLNHCAFAGYVPAPKALWTLGDAEFFSCPTGEGDDVAALAGELAGWLAANAIDAAAFSECDAVLADAARVFLDCRPAATTATRGMEAQTHDGPVAFS